MGEGFFYIPKQAEFCNGKVRYDKKGVLTAQNARFKEKHVRLRIYECPDCRGWHLTHKRVYQDDKYRRF